MQTAAAPFVAASPVQQAYDRLRAAQRANPFPSRADREDRLERMEKMLRIHQESFVTAISADFGNRSRQESLLADVMITLDAVRNARKNVGKWMERQAVRPKWFFLPSSSYIEHLPRGVVAIIAPWNYPVVLALGPLAEALAAGNRVIIKPSELTPKTSEAIARAIRESFSSEEVTVLEGDHEVARAITQLPLDHLLFTGSTHVGRQVARAAAENLTSVTLELGGKSPTLVHPDYPIAKAAERIAIGKCFNAGQTCIAPDYVLVPRGSEEKFATAFRDAVRRLYPDPGNNPDYTSIINPRSLERLKGLLNDAESKGAKVERIAELPAQVGARKLSPTLVFGANDSMKVMQEEIFGPILPIQGYDSVDGAIEYVNSHPRPLAFYYFDEDQHRAGEVLRRTISGGACVNDTLLHFAQEDLPFGGIGNSGQGAYHGYAGFQVFSHARGVYVASSLSQVGRLQAPPYGPLLDRAIKFLLR